MPKITYDPDAKIIGVRLAESRSVNSILEGNLVFDYDADGKIVNIDIMEADLNDPELLSSLDHVYVPREAKDIKKIRVDIDTGSSQN